MSYKASHCSLKPVALISPLSSRRLTLKSLPSLFCLCHVLISDLFVTLALIVHLWAYGDNDSIGYMVAWDDELDGPVRDGSARSWAAGCWGGGLLP